jgi:hypothetical protein
VGEGLRLPDSFNDGGLALRPPTPEDVDRITEICQDPDIQRFTRVPVPYGRQDAESFVAMATDALQQGRGAHLLVEKGRNGRRVCRRGYRPDRSAGRSGLLDRALSQATRHHHHGDAPAVPVAARRGRDGPPRTRRGRDQPRLQRSCQAARLPTRRHTAVSDAVVRRRRSCCRTCRCQRLGAAAGRASLSRSHELCLQTVPFQTRR